VVDEEQDETGYGPERHEDAEELDNAVIDGDHVHTSRPPAVRCGLTDGKAVDLLGASAVHGGEATDLDVA
jgi:hypothetical protein